MYEESKESQAINANGVLPFPPKMKKKWADELVIASRELAFQQEQSEKRIAEMISTASETGFKSRVFKSEKSTCSKLV